MIEPHAHPVHPSTLLVLAVMAGAACGTSEPTGRTTEYSGPAEPMSSPSTETVDTTAAPPPTTVGDVATTASTELIEPAWWRLRSSKIDPGSTSIPILVVEQGCSSGANAEGRIVADVIESNDQVRIDVAVKPLEGAQTCEGIPPTLYTVELDEPLGDRQIVGTSDPERVPDPRPRRPHHARDGRHLDSADRACHHT